MSITHSRLKKFSSFDLVNAHFIHPKLIIQEDTEKVRICDLTARTEEDPDKVYNFDTKISNTHVHRELLWVLFRSGDIIVINPATGTQIKVTCEKLANYKIQKLRSSENNVILISKSGECLVVLFSRKDLEQDMVDGKAEHTIAIDKYGGSYLAAESHMLSNGLIAYTEGEALVLKCPITGLYDVINSTKKILYAVPWVDSLIISDGATMWLVDIKDSHIMYEFKEDGITYYPLGSYNNDFYYLAWDEMQVYICCAWDESLLDSTNDQHDNNSSIQKLSSQETLKGQLKTIIDSLTSTTDPDQVLPQIQPYFDTIEDLPLLVNTALKLCKINLALKPLTYTLQKKVFASADDFLIQSLCDIMNKIDILEYIEFRGSNLYEDLSIFDLSFVELCITFVSKGDFDLSSICWLKYSAVKQTINSNDIMGILNAIPNNIKMGALINWLRNFLPPLLDENPFYIDLFVRWVTERVFSLEKSSYWPKIGLKFIDDIGIVLETSLKTICLRPISMDDLDMLKTHIKNIIELKEKHKINMLLGELSSQSPSEVALIMLRRCYTEDLEPFLQHYLPSYSARNSFEIDDTLRSFIEIEAASSGGDVDGVRLKILLNSFRLHTNKLECFLQVLKVLDVPWNQIVLELAVEAASSGKKDFTTTATDRLLAEQIQRELNYAKVKVILKKYKFSLKCTDYQLVLHKMITAPSIDLDDLKVITSVLTDYANYGSLLYLNRCLCDCDTRGALEYFNQMPSKEKKILLKSVMIKYEQIIKGSSNEAIVERNYVDFLKGSKMLNDLEVNTIENMYYLKNSFETKLSINDLYCEHSANEVDITMNVSDAGRSGCLAQLTRTHQTSRSTLIALLHRTSSNHEVRKLVEALLITAETQEHCHTQIASVLANFRDGNNSAILMECCHVLTELVSTCTEEHIHRVIKYLSMLTALVNANIVVKNLSIAWKFHYIFLPMSSLSTLNDLIDFYISPYNYLARNPGICQSRGDFIPIRIVVNIAEDISSSGKDLPGELLQIRNKICKQLLNKVVASQELDELLITILLDLLSKDEADKIWIIDMLRGQNESLSHAAIAYLAQPVIRRSFSAFCLTQNTVAYSPQYMLKTKFKFNVADLALSEINNDETWDTKVVLFFFLKQYPETSLDRLIELCRTLHIPVNEGLSFQLISLLTTWELKYKIFNDDIGCCQTHFENDESHLLPNCVKLWESIKDKDFIKDVLTDLWKNGEVTLHGRIVSINPYYYEVYLCIYYLLYGSSTDSEYMKEYYLLNFLKNYNRKSTPKQHEFELFSVKGMFPEIGHHRLPFHLFMREDMWANLKSEITLETYEQWLPAVALLSLDADIQTARDMICSNALKQTMTSRKKCEGTETEQKESEPWRLTTREEPLLRAAHRCVKHIANMEWAGACLFYVLQGCARGADQVAAAQLCYQFAQRWSAVQPGNRAVRQMERLHSTLSTRHILHKVEWACEEFVRLSTEPTQLIRNLYLHPNFVEKISRHDINRAANEIADKNGINISSIRIEILENILEKSNEENKNKTSFGLDNKDLTTAKYILKATCPKMGAIYLSRIALDDENDYNKSKKLRALQCLMSIIDSDTASKVTNRERDSLWNTLLELLYIVNLEHIDMPWIVATFMNDKLGALDQLLQAVGGNVEGLKITGELAWRFGNIKIIPKVIPSLLRAGLYDELVPLLLKIASATDKTVSEAWRTVLLSPFQQADYPITERQRAKCLNAVNLLPVCPVIRDADLIEIWKNCVRCKCFGIGCLLLPYMTTESRQILSELQKIDRRNLIASLKNLQTETYLVPGAMHVLESMASRSYGRSQKT